MTNRSLMMTSAVAALVLGVSAAASGQTTTQQIRAQQAQIDYMKRQIQIMQDKLAQMQTASSEIQKQSQATAATVQKIAAAPDAATVTLKKGRPTFTSQDGNYQFSLTGRVHLDAANYFGAAHGLALNNGVNARRAYLGVDAFFTKDIEAYLDADFGNASGNESSTSGYLHEARVTYTGLKFLGLGPLAVEIGYMQPLSSLEDATSSNNITFLERATAINMSRNVAASERRFAFGARDYGDWWTARAYYTGALIGVGNSNGFPNSATTTCASGTPPTCTTSLSQTSVKNEQSGMMARLTALPWSDDQSLVHVGVNAQYVFNPDETNTGGFPRHTVSLAYRPGFTVDGNNFIGTNGSIITKTGATAPVNNATSGTINVEHATVLGGELAGQWRNFSLQGEWIRFILDTSRPISGLAASPSLNFDGAYVAASYVLTGESRAYDKSAGAFGAILPTNPFDPSIGNWGAWEVAARFEQDNMNDRSGSLLVEGGRETTYTAGINWYWNSNVRFMLDYLYTDVRRAAISGTGATAKLVPGTSSTTGRGNLGASFNGMALRSQFAF